MGDHKIPKDDVDAAIDRVEAQPDAATTAQRAEFPNHFFADFAFKTGEKLRIIVPNTFDSDQFETCVGILMQLRVTADQRRAAEQVIVTPDKPRLIAMDGRRLT